MFAVYSTRDFFDCQNALFEKSISVFYLALSLYVEATCCMEGLFFPPPVMYLFASVSGEMIANLVTSPVPLMYIHMYKIWFLHH